MSKKFVPYKKDVRQLISRADDSFAFLIRPLIIATLAFIVLTFLFSLLIYQRYRLIRESSNLEALAIVNLAKDRLQESINHSLSATRAISFFIDNDGKISNFDSIAPQILKLGKDIDAIQLVPDGVIKYVYPLKGNESVIGYNILKDPARNKEAFKAIELNEIFFAGPFALKQGGMGVVGRLPLYRNNRFWGFSAVVIKMSTLIKTANIDAGKNKKFYFQLSKLNPDTKAEEFFLPVREEKNLGQSVSIDVPNGEWKLSVSRVDQYGWMGDIGLLTLLGFLLSLFGALFTYRIAVMPRKLNRIVKEKTADLVKSESKYRSVIERVSDAFVALDKDWKYVYVNEKAGEIFGRDPQHLLGKLIWQEFPKGIDQPFYHAYHKAMESQEYQYLEEYYPSYDKWFENHIYPSKDGLTVFFKDVTAIKQIRLALKLNEEKYRSLIEQASDGIVITNMEGIIIEVNNSICKMIGYTGEEMVGKHVVTFLPENDNDEIPIRINELMKGKNLLYQRRIVKKDGIALDVEVNSKMASTHTLIGFIRDISVRKEQEKTLNYQAMLLESVSDAITSIDVNRTIVSWNKACENLYGFSYKEVKGRRMKDLVSFEYRDNSNEEAFETVHREGSWKGEFSFIHPKSGKKVFLLSGINSLKDGAGNINGYIITSSDITDKVAFETALRISNDRFEMIAEATNDVIWDHDIEKNETWGNANLYELYGFGAGDHKINFQSFIENIHPDERQGIEKRLNEAIEQRKVSISEIFKFKNAKGEYRTFYDRAYIKYNESGIPERFLGAMQDITERMEAQKAITESEGKYRTIIEQAADGIFIANDETYFIDVNTAGCRLSGYTKEELLKLTFLDVIPPEDLIANPLKIVKMERGQSVTNERRLICKGGSIMEVEITAKKLQDGRYQLFVRDIGERKKAAEKLQQSERKYKLLFNNNPHPMWMSDLPDFNIIDVNTAAMDQYGYSREEFLKLNLEDLRPSEDVAHFVSQVNNIDLKFFNNRQWRHKRKDGSTLLVEVLTHEIIYDGKKVWLSLPQDITEKQQAKELLQKSYEEIRQLASNLQNIREDERTNIAREIHDELGQQLTGLKMDLHWLIRKIKSTDEEVITKMNESLELINATIISVRKISTNLRPSILDDLGLLPALEWQGSEFEKRSGTSVEFINNAGDITVKSAATTGIFRIYQELLTNIARHANASLVNAILYKDEDRLYFDVKDNGVGFDLRNIQNKKTLGLLGIKERTLLLGGTYELKSRLGKGAEIKISFPLNVIENTT